MSTISEHLKNRAAVDNRYSLSEIFVDDFVSPGRRRYGLWKPAQIKSHPETALDDGTYDLYTVTIADIGRLDLIAWKYYNSVDWWWVIAYYNSIVNPLVDMVEGQVLRIPKKTYIIKAFESGA